MVVIVIMGILAALIVPRLIGAVQHARHDQRGQNPHDHNHHHDLDQGETLLTGKPAR